MKRQATTKEKLHMCMVSALSCACCCKSGPSQVHHIRDGAGMAQKSSNWLTIPLCVECHTGNLGVHGDRSWMRIYGISELDMLADTIRKLVN